jgi:hypothetical protein
MAGHRNINVLREKMGPARVAKARARAEIAAALLEYGLTPTEMKKAERRIRAEIRAARARGDTRKFTGPKTISVELFAVRSSIPNHLHLTSLPAAFNLADRSKASAASP